ncbi:type VI secretion system Vgr family protein [Hyalangium rubrum]|uniref:Type VI secretion system tip protein TssI/VgrG n=1 Tax=Hyalangium rubrum TaxID=3103134 RepID=A0ABU5GUI8_9BACT|nr:type VI secretion system tip protein TssI/VgrG [Hyalangium sp. s54d21]MDY7224854.1 type VI secretion system tip protein TssI/VgrG [Hyalangium sp. s54d21]
MDVFTLTCDKLPTETRVMRVSGHEGLSRLYSFTLDLVMPGDEGLSFDMGEAINTAATLDIHEGNGTRRGTFHGILSTVDWVQEVADNAIYRVTLVPRLWRLGLSVHSNVFVDKTVKDIAMDVLLSNGLKEKKDFEFRLGPTKYEKMPHVSQYRESDLDFLSRRLERDGLYYFFEQLDAGEKLIITDAQDKHTASGSVRYFPQGSSETMGTEALHAFVCRHQIRPKQVKLREYDYLRPTMDLMKTDPVVQNGDGDVVSHDENYSTPGEGQRLAKVRSEELKSREVVFEGHGLTYDVRPGYTFDVTAHPRPSFNVSYLAVAVTHEGTQGVLGEGPQQEPQAPTYLVRMEAIPATVQFRPRRLTPIPRIYGTEMGVVDGEQDSTYAQIDSHGRYKVQVFFDENDPRNGKASMWLRMLQPHGGPNEGFHFPLRKNTEVMLVFLGGDPDRPVIAGVVPNTHTPSPVTVDNATHNVILTGGGTRMEIEDNDGAQYLKITTPPESTLLHLGAPDGAGYNVHLSSMGKGLVEFGGDLDIRVDGHQTEEVTLDVREHYKAKRDTTVDSDHKVEVKGKEDYKVHGNQKTEVLSNREVKVTSNQKHEVGGNDEVKVTGNQTVKVTGNQETTVTGNQKNTVTGNQTETITGNVMQTVTGNVTQTHSANLTHTVVGSATVSYVADKKESIVGAEASFKISATSETVLGVKNENIIVSKIDSVLGSAIEAIIGLKVATHLGPSIEVTSVLKLGKRGISLSAIDLEVKNTTGPRIGNAALEIACRAITIFP